MAETVEQAVMRRACVDGISLEDMPGGWAVVIARKGPLVRVWYYHKNDHVRYVAALKEIAQDTFKNWPDLFANLNTNKTA